PPVWLRLPDDNYYHPLASRQAAPESIGAEDFTGPCMERFLVLLDELPRAIDRNGEADPLSLGVDRGIDADRLAHHIQQRAARVARVDRGVSLDEIAVAGFTDRPMQRADHTHSYRVREPEGVADRDRGFADHQ